MKQYRALIVAFSLLSISVLSIFSNSLYAEDLIVYSGRKEKFVKPLAEAFTQKTGINIDLRSGNSSILLSKLVIEDNRTKADIYLSNDVGNLQRGSDFNIFRPISKNIANLIDTEFRAPSNTWLGLSGRIRVLVVNTNSPLANKIHSIFDLASPRLRGRIGITKASNESFIAGVTTYMLATDKEKVRTWLKGIRNNLDSKVYNKHSKVVKAVAKGEKDVGLVNHYYYYRYKLKHPNAPIKILIPNQSSKDIGVAWNMAGIAISRYSKKAKLAEKFVSFLVSEEGQRIFAEVNREYPTRSSVPAATEVLPFSSYKLAHVPLAQIGKQREATINNIFIAGLPYD